MADPTEMKKGGFGAFAAMHRERYAARAAAARGGPSAEPGREPAAAPVVGPADVPAGERGAEPGVPPRIRADKTTVRPPGAGGTVPRGR